MISPTKVVLALGTFFAFSCGTYAQQGDPVGDAQLCRSQLELLQGNDALTEDEAAVFEAQCDCLEQKGSAGQYGEQSECTQGEV